MLQYPKRQALIATNRKRARKLRRRWFADLERVIDKEDEVKWEDIQQSDYWIRTFSFTREDQPYWGTFIIQFLPVPEGLKSEAEPDRMAMLGICQCSQVIEEEWIDGR